MKIDKKLSSLLALVMISGMLWHTSASASSDTDSTFQPKVLRWAERTLERGKPDQTLAQLAPRVEKMPNGHWQAQGYALMCKAHFQKGELVEAEKACDSAVAASGDNDNWSHFNNRGVMRLLQGRFTQAGADFDRAATLNPRSKGVRKNLALTTREQQKQHEALTALSQARSL